MIEDGTAIRSALATAVNRLRGVDGQKQSGDPVDRRGVNNAGAIPPLAAARNRRRPGGDGLYHRRRLRQAGPLPSDGPLGVEGLPERRDRAG